MPIDPTTPADDSLIGAFPANERANRTTIKNLLEKEHDGTQGRHKIPVVADAAARDAGNPSPASGNLVYRLDTDKMEIYDGTSWVVTIPDVVIPAPVLRGYLFGLTLSRTATVDITIAPGLAVSSDGLSQMPRSTNLVKKIDAAWTVGTGVGGRSGALTNVTWYHVFLILSAAGVVDAGFDTSLTAVNLLAASGYIKYRRLGSVFYIDGVSFLRDFVQQQNRFYWKDPVGNYLDTDADIGTTAVLIALSVPPDVAVVAKMNIFVRSFASEASLYLSSPQVTDLLPTPTGSPGTTIVRGDASDLAAQVEALTNTSKQVRARADTNSIDLRISTYGWIDPLGE